MVKNKTAWGGDWTNQKLDAFEKYVNAYLAIMHSQKRKYNGWPTTIYFDGFAGSGSRFLSQETENLFKDFNYNKEAEVYKGSVERVLSLALKFDYYYFVDNNQDNIESLKRKLLEQNLITSNCHFIHGDVNEQLLKFAALLDKQKAALVFLDPFGMQIQWSSIEPLKDKRVDLWILVPSGVIINRLLDKKGDLQHIELLESYFGLQEEEIRKEFYQEKTDRTLFGDIGIVEKTKDAIHKIAKIYVQNLKKIFKYVTKQPLVLRNSKNVPIYHFVFASNNKTALTIASQIIEKKQK